MRIDRNTLIEKMDDHAWDVEDLIQSLVETEQKLEDAQLEIEKLQKEIDQMNES